MNYNKFETESLDNRWFDLLVRLGVDPTYLRNKHGPCPGCGGKDRFRFDDKSGRGTFVCGGGGDITAGDGFTLLEHIYGWSFKESLRRITGDCKPLPAPRIITSLRADKSPTETYAKQVWERAVQDDAHVSGHPYAIKKDIRWACGAGRAIATGKVIGKDADCLVIPMRTLSHKLTGIECINADGVKQTFGRKGALMLGNDLDKELDIHICEGWASAVAIFRYYHAHLLVYAVFAKARLDPVADQLDALFDGKRLILTHREDCK